MLGRGQLLLGRFIIAIGHDPGFILDLAGTHAILRGKGFERRIFYQAMLQDLAYQHETRLDVRRVFSGLADDLDYKSGSFEAGGDGVRQLVSKAGILAAGTLVAKNYADGKPRPQLISRRVTGHLIFHGFKVRLVMLRLA